MIFLNEKFYAQSQTLCVLKIGYVELSIFKSILSVCPNLSYLDMGITIPSTSSTPIESHVNLKHLILRTSYNIWLENKNELILKDLYQNY